MAQGDAASFAALSAALALVVAGVFVVGGLLRIGGVSDLISKPIPGGFLFGLGMTIAVGQLPKLLGVEGGSGNFFPKLCDLLGELDETSATTLTVGAGSLAALVVLRRRAPALPASLIVLVAAIAVSAAAGLDDHGVAVIGHIPAAFPTFEVPDVSGHDVAELVGGAFGVALVGHAEAITVARSTAAAHGYAISADRELIGLGGANLLAGLFQGFAQSGGASQTAAADRSGGRTQATSLVAAVLVLITGGLLAPLFRDLPQATLAAIVIVAITGGAANAYRGCSQYASRDRCSTPMRPRSRSGCWRSRAPTVDTPTRSSSTSAHPPTSTSRVPTCSPSCATRSSARGSS